MGVALWRLSAENSYRTISEVLGIGKSILINTGQDITQELFQVYSDFISLLVTILEYSTATEAFSECTKCSLPQAWKYNTNRNNM